MPIQERPWTEFMSCPVCFKFFNEKQQRPISLGCGHTVCKSCIKNRLKDNKCPFDQNPLPSDVDKLPANFALMHLVGAAIPEQEREVTKTKSDNPKSYEEARKFIEDMAVQLRPLAENASDDEDSIDSCNKSDVTEGSNRSTSRTTSSNSGSSNNKCVLSRPMQRKLISLIHCQLLEEEGRQRAARIARSIGERIVSELLVLNQFPHQLSANLWAAVRARGCQFLGPAMQEEVLKLILLALEDGSSLSRKVLVLFVVQRLEGRYPQASKTAIGHVVQLLYRASCFKVDKQDGKSSLMLLKEEFRQYECLRREHDSQVVQLALEAGLRISPEQWSSLLYGDSAHKSHMQSIIDKHQSPQSFAQSITELMTSPQRIKDNEGLLRLQPQFEFLSSIDPSPDCPAPSWENLEAVMRALHTVMSSFVEFLSNPDHKTRLDTAPSQNTRYKTSLCRDFSTRSSCPRGNTCTFAHSQEELEKYRSRSRRFGSRGPVNAQEKTSSSLTSSENDQLKQIQMMSNLKLNAVNHGLHTSKMLGSQSELQAHAPSVAELIDPKHAGMPPHGFSNRVGNPPLGTAGPPPLRPVIGVDPKGPLALIGSAPPPVLRMPSPVPNTRLTFSKPHMDVNDSTLHPQLSVQTSLHPHNPHAVPFIPRHRVAPPSFPNGLIPSKMNAGVALPPRGTLPPDYRTPVPGTMPPAPGSALPVPGETMIPMPGAVPPVTITIPAEARVNEMGGDRLEADNTIRGDALHPHHIMPMPLQRLAAFPANPAATGHMVPYPVVPGPPPAAFFAASNLPAEFLAQRQQQQQSGAPFAPPIPSPPPSPLSHGPPVRMVASSPQLCHIQQNEQMQQHLLHSDELHPQNPHQQMPVTISPINPSSPCFDGSFMYWAPILGDDGVTGMMIPVAVDGPGVVMKISNQVEEPPDGDLAGREIEPAMQQAVFASVEALPSNEVSLEENLNAEIIEKS